MRDVNVLKKIIVVCFALLICFTLVACGNNYDGDENIQESKTEDSSNVEVSNTEDTLPSALEFEIEKEQSADAEDEMVTGNYYIHKIYESDFINVTDKVWVLATDTTNEFEAVNYFLLIDLEGHIDAKIEEKYGMKWKSSIGETMIVLEKEGSTDIYIFDTQGNDITNKWCGDEGEQVISVAKDSTGYTVWTRRTNQTFETYEVILRAYDEFGIIKEEWSSEQVKNEMDFSSVYFISDYEDRKPVYLGGTVYYLRKGGYKDGIYGGIDTYNIYLDVENGAASAVEIHNEANGAGFSSNDGTYTLYYQDRDVQIFTSNETVCTGINCDDWLYPHGTISEGLFYARQGEINGRGGYCMVNHLGDIQFYFEHEPLNNPAFHFGRAALSMRGAGGIVYTTLVDINGNWMFEPVQGEFVEYCEALDMNIIKDDNGRHILDDSGNKILYPFEEVTFWVVDEQNTSYAYLCDGALVLADFDF